MKQTKNIYENNFIKDFSKNIELKPIFDIKGILELVPIGRSTLYEEIKAGRLRHSKMGRRTLFRLNDVQAWLDGMHSGAKVERKDHV